MIHSDRKIESDLKRKAYSLVKLNILKRRSIEFHDNFVKQFVPNSTIEEFNEYRTLYLNVMNDVRLSS